jgi:hypothetical protein
LPKGDFILSRCRRGRATLFVAGGNHHRVGQLWEHSIDRRVERDLTLIDELQRGDLNTGSIGDAEKDTKVSNWTHSCYQFRLAT